MMKQIPWLSPTFHWPWIMNPLAAKPQKKPSWFKKYFLNRHYLTNKEKILLKHKIPWLFTDYEVELRISLTQYKIPWLFPRPRQIFFPRLFPDRGNLELTEPNIVETLLAGPMAGNVARAKIMFPTDLFLFIYSPTHGFVGVIRDNTVQVTAQFTISILFKALIYYTGLVSSITESFATSRETKRAANFI